MSELLEKTSPLTPASFSVHQVAALTVGQRMILDLLSNALKAGKSVSRDDIINCYIRCRYPKGVRIGWGVETGWDPINLRLNYKSIRCNIPVNTNGYVERVNGMQWFKNNLGSCIIKGRLLAIPVIDVQE